MVKSFDNISLPCVMAIINVTPDSFSDGGKFFDPDSALQRLNNVVSDGADIVDIGGETTKPGAVELPSELEWQRIKNIVRSAVQLENVAVSVDTYHIDVAKLALEKGVNIINDVCATWHFQEMASLVKEYDGHLIVTHNSRNDDSFLKLTDPISSIIEEFLKVLDKAAEINFDQKRIIFDPGIGFGKTQQQNLEILKNIGELCSSFSSPIVCATSKKSFLKTNMNNTSDRSLLGATVATTVIGLQRGCKIFRVHDVEENLAAIKVFPI